MKHFISILGLLLFLSCHSQSKKQDVENCTRQHALDLLLKIPEVKNQDKYVDSLTHHTKGLTMIDYDEGKPSSKPYYEINVGYSSDIRFENFFTFRVSKNDCSIIVDDPEKGLISLKDWELTSISHSSVVSNNDKNVELPYDKKNNINNVRYNTLESDIEGVSEFLCGEDALRYLPLPAKNDIRLLLVPQDCGDFPYRFYLLTVKNNKVISNLYVEGESFEPENPENTKEVSSFKIDKDFIITVQTSKNKKVKSRKYKIDIAGKIVGFN